MVRKPAADKKAVKSALSDADLKRLGATIADALKPDEKPEPANNLKRIDEIIKNSRATWFALLGALVFAAVTLASVKDVAFFVSDVQTKLPIANISVPVTSFFWAGSLLIAALYIYFHLYLEQLWDALGEAPARVNGKPLADCIHPWLVSDTALRVRDWLRANRRKSPYADRPGLLNKIHSGLWLTRRHLRWSYLSLRNWLRDVPALSPDNRCSRRRGMSWISNVISVGLVWLFGLSVIIWFWWRSMPAHSFRLTAWLALVLIVTLWVFWGSACGVLAKLGGWPRRVWARGLFAAFAVLIGLTTLTRVWDGAFWGTELIEGNARAWLLHPAPAQLAEVEFTKKPAGWRGKAWEERQFRSDWCKQAWRHADSKEPCKRSKTDDGSIRFGESKESAFQKDWKARWGDMRNAFEKPDLRQADLRAANLFDARLEGANLEDARLSFARLEGANLEGARLSFARLEGANLRFAGLFGERNKAMDLKSTRLSSANFSRSLLRRVDLSGTDMAELRNTASSFGDGSVKTPAGFERPGHWCKTELDDAQYFGRLRTWLGNNADWAMTEEELEKYPAIPEGTPCPAGR